MIKYSKYLLLLIICIASCHASEKKILTPIKIEADKVELYNKKGRAIFSGDVILRKGDMTIKTSRIECNYEEADDKRISRIDIPGRLEFTRGDNFLVASNASYDIKTGKLRLAGEIKGMYRGLVLKADSFTIDLRELDK